MSEILLTGLQGSEPIGFLACLGLLRVGSRRPALGGVTLGWTQPAGGAGVLVTGTPCDQDRLVDELLGHMHGRHELPLLSGRPAAGASIGGGAWDDVKVDPALFAALLQAVRPQVNRGERESADFLAALGSECARALNKNEVKPTALHMTSGNQQFLEALRELARSLDASQPAHAKASCPPAEALREAIFGEWRSADAFSSLGYDPATEAVYALTAAAPTDTGPRSTRAAVWLAVEALPLFPCFPVGRRLHTRGFDRAAGRFRWPLWEGRLSLAAVRTVLGLPELSVPQPAPTVLRSYGIAAVFESSRVTIGKGYGQFRPGIRVG